MPKIRSHLLHLPHYTFDNSRNLRLLYGIRVLRDLVNKMAMFFLPIFLFKVGSEENFFFFLNLSPFQEGMLTISIYYVVVGFIGFFSGVPGGKLLGKIGYQRTFVLAFMFRTIMFLSLFYARANPFFLIPAMIIDGLNGQLFWGGYFSLLTKVTHKNNMGKDLGLLQFLLQLVAVISPAVSGFIAFLVGVEYLFLIGMVMTLLSSILSLMMETKIKKNRVSFKNFLKWTEEIRFVRLGIAYSGKYIHDTLIYMWPLYIFFILGSIERVGYLYTLSLFLAMFFTFFTGKYIDQHKKNKKPFYLSGGLLSILWLLRTQVIGIWSIALVDTVDRLATNVYALFFDTMFIKRGKGHDSDEYFIYAEMILSLVRIVFWSLFGLFFLLFRSWDSLFIFAGVAVLFSLLISDKKTTYV